MRASRGHYFVPLHPCDVANVLEIQTRAKGLVVGYHFAAGLNSAFTIHDREDSADLMNLVRHERGLSKTESRFPAKGTCLSGTP
jgi:hypothetical protein